MSKRRRPPPRPVKPIAVKPAIAAPTPVPTPVPAPIPTSAPIPVPVAPAPVPQTEAEKEMALWFLLNRTGLVTNITAPGISGTTTQGQTLTKIPGTWSGSGYSIATQWKRTGVDIGGATSTTYVLQAADVGTTITVMETMTKPAIPTLTATSNPTATIAASGAPAANTFINDFATTGNSTLGSAVLTLISVTGLSVGDILIAETKLNRGVPGVGKQFPTQTLANEAAIATSGTVTAGDFIGSFSTGYMYERWDNGVDGTWTATFSSGSNQITSTSSSSSNYIGVGVMVGGTGIPAGSVILADLGSNVWRISNNTTSAQTNTTVTTRYRRDPNQYYWLDIVPMSMVAEIAAINTGAKTCTMVYPGTATPFLAGATETTMNVYVDNRPMLSLLNNSQMNVLDAKHGRYSGNLQYADAQHIGMALRGQTKATTRLSIPRGCPSNFAQWFQATGVEVSNIRWDGNFGDNGYGFQTTNGNNIQDSQYGILFSNLDSGNIHDCDIYDAATLGFATRANNNTIATDVTLYVSFAEQRYLQWQFDFANSATCIATRVGIISTYLARGFECFASSGCQFLECYGTNILISMNSQAGTYFRNLSTRYTVGCYRTDVLMPISPNFTVTFDVNNNISNRSAGNNAAPGTGMEIENWDNVIEGECAPGYFMAAMRGGAADIWVHGTVSVTLPASGGEKGLIVGPWRSTNDFGMDGPRWFIDGSRFRIEGMWVKSAAVYGGAAQGTIQGLSIYGTQELTLNTAINASATGVINAYYPGYDYIGVSNQWAGTGFLTIGSERIAYATAARVTTTGASLTNSYTGNLLVGSTANLLPGGSNATIGTEVVSYTVVNSTTVNITGRGQNNTTAASHLSGVSFTDTQLTISLTTRGVAGTTAASHSIGATITYLDTPYVVNNVINNIAFAGGGVTLRTESGNLTNAQKLAL